MEIPHNVDLSHDQLDCLLTLDSGLRLERCGCPSAAPWIDPSSAVFSVLSEGRRFTGREPGAAVRAVHVNAHESGATHAVIAVAYGDSPLEVDLHVIVYPGASLLEQWVTVRNASKQSVRIEQIDSISLRLRPAECELFHFVSSWGAEFESMCRPLRGSAVLENRSGRSSNGTHPFFALMRDGEILSGAIAWSGNWIVRFEPVGAGYALSGGLDDWEFFTDLSPGEEISGPHLMLAMAEGDLNDISQQYHRVGRQYWYPRNAASERLPLEWNHWWSYEDHGIDEITFRANVAAADQLGLQACTLDAGWFGPSVPTTDWIDYRGDWDQINTARFPSGIDALAKYVHDRGLLFGLWCEIEGLGRRANLARRHTSFVARRDEVPLGYVCFGCPEVEPWAFDILERLVLDYGCDWIKLDFNRDPGAGCNRLDHGHGPGDGLYTHYRGFYAMLARFRRQYPEVILENCSSGGLRIDLGIMQQTHLTFLSDPDLPEHSLQVFWGASTLLAPGKCLHWSWSQWIHEHPHQTFDPRDPHLTQHQLDYIIRVALLGAAGFSLRLPDLPAWVAERIAFHARLYEEYIKRFVRAADLYRLTGQPGREGRGDRWCAFQYSLPDEHLLYVFRLPGAEPRRALSLHGLDPRGKYRLQWLGERREETWRGGDLMEPGLVIDYLDHEDSAIILLDYQRQ